jgi:dCTP deaminase
VLHPGEFVLGATYERIALPDDIVARIEGKSSLGRLGLVIHATAGFIDAGFDGDVTLELSNVATLPILLYPGMRVAQLAFFGSIDPRSAPTARARAARSTRGSAARPRPATTSTSSSHPRPGDRRAASGVVVTSPPVTALTITDRT